MSQLKSELIPETLVSKRNTITIPDNVHCPRCKSKDVVSGGKRYNKDKVVQKYKCRVCATHFSNPEWLRGKHPLDLVNYAVSLYLKGYSGRKIAKILKDFGNPVSHTTITRHWLRMMGYEARQRNIANKLRKHPELLAQVCETKKEKIQEVIEILTNVRVSILSSSNPDKVVDLELETINVVEI